MKFVILAATVGYVFGAIDADCGTLTAGETPCADGEYCNKDANSSEDTAGTDTNSGTCAARIADGQTCDPSTGAPCLTTAYCATDTCTATVADGEACTVAEACTGGACDGACGTCGAAPTNADGAVGGSCCGGNPTDADANYCANNVVTAKVADDGVCSVALSGGDCVSGSCTATAATDDADDVGACDATAIADGATGGACRTVVAEAAEVTGCGTDLTCSTDGGDGVVFCQNASGEPAAIDSAAAAGAQGGVCTAAAVTAVTACDGTDVCNETVCGAATEAPTEAATTEAPADGDSPAAIFYGMSMVTGAIAYLL